MKEITSYTGTTLMFHVISEPGDATHYDYFVYKDYDDYCFMPRMSTIRYPQRLNFFDIQHLIDVSVEDFRSEKVPLDVVTNTCAEADKLYCNVYTLLECCRTIGDLRK